MKGIYPKLTREYIEKILVPEEVFAYYLQINISEIYRCLSGNYLICSPLRIDKNPTCGFYYANGKLRFNDFAGYFHGDMYDVVGYLNLLDSKDGIDFAKIMNIIARDFKIWEYEDSNNITRELIVKAEGRLKEKIIFDVEFRDFSYEDYNYWTVKYHIDLDKLKQYGIYPIYSYWINKQLKYNHSYNDICYGYYEGKDENGIANWQFYHPYRDKVRFITNYAGIRGRKNIKKRAFGVLTKSVKDIVVLDLFNINAVSLGAEGIFPSPSELNKINQYWSRKFCLTDFDITGIRIANKLRKKGYEPLFLTNGRFNTWNYNAKDISDFIETYGYSKTKDLIEYLIDEYDNGLTMDYYDFLMSKNIR